MTRYPYSRYELPVTPAKDVAFWESLDEDTKLAIKRGVEWLDENAPQGWRALIDWQAFSIHGCKVCVLGQIFGDYYRAPRPHDADGSNRGLDYAFYEDTDATGFVLTDAWRVYARMEDAV